MTWLLVGVGVPRLLVAQGTPPIRGFAPDRAAAEHRVEQRLASLLDRDSTKRWFRLMTDAPHPAGSARNKLLADSVAARFKAWGWDEVALRRYDVLLPWPTTVRVRMTAPTTHEATLTERCYPQDAKACTGRALTYLGMSASGDVSGEVIYANSGNPADYDLLEARGISVRGKIAIVRYSNPYSYRGFKALTAERRGVKAMLIYSDPQDDGYRRGLTFPEGPWGPETHIQRGAISYDFIIPGDPLTPGTPSIPGVPRISAEASPAVPKVIAVPISAADAAPMLRALRGPVAPAEWQGALPFTYRLGTGATARVNVQMDNKTRAIWVVEARIRGSEEPDKTVVLGNHRDAWVYGAVDPASGTATQMELARALGRLVQEGHRPRRSIVMGNWDAEEWHLTGSTEWGEQFARELSAGAVAYLNVDGSTSGPNFEASAVATLNPLVVETARDVADPATGGSLLAAWSAPGRATRRGVPIDTSALVTNKLGSGSDYTVFLNHLGIPIVDLSFGGPYGVYHSQYDNAYWMEHFGDPGYRYMTTMADVWGRMALRLANADVLPYDVPRLATLVGRFLDELATIPGVPSKLDVRPALAAQAAWRVAADSLEARMKAASAGSAGTTGLAAMNEALRTIEAHWLLEGGIPGRPWFRHVLYAPRFTYAAMELPGVREALDAGDWTRAATELARLTERIAAVARATRAATATVGPAVP